MIKNFDFAGDDLDTGEAISAINSVTISPSGAGDLLKDAESFLGNIVTLKLSGGRTGIQYEILVRITTTKNQILECLGRMVVGQA